MDLVLLRLTPGPEARTATVSPEIATDILWATATAEDRVEHIRARPAPDGAIDVALFHHRGDTGSPPTDLALRVARTATTNASTLTGWTAQIVTPYLPLNVLVAAEREPQPDLRNTY